MMGFFADEKPPGDSEFKLHIDLGDQAMKDAKDVVGALRTIGTRLMNGEQEGIVKDINGNTCGHWSLHLPESEDS